MKDKIQFIELSTLIYFSVRSSFIGIGINSYLYFGKVDAYLSVIIGIFVGILPLLLILKIAKFKKDATIHEINQMIFGKKIGNFINILLIGFTFFYASILFYDLINFISSEYLYKTPSTIIGIMLLFPIIYIIPKGLKTIARTSTILFIISIILYLFSIGGLIPSFSFENLLPFLENGIQGSITGSINHIAYAVLPIFLFTIIPRENIQEEKKLTKGIIFAQIFASIICLLSLLNVIGVLGIDLALLYQYPDYHMLRRIQVGGFIQRVESILAIQWMLCLFMMIAFCMFYCLKGTETIFPKLTDKQKKLLGFIFPTMMLLTARITFQNNTEFINFTIHDFPKLIYLFFLGIPCLIFLTYFIRKKLHN
jgi:spore germination protein KB